MKKPKIYISGPMTGKADYNRPAFETACQALDLLGFEPVNPHNNGLPQSASYNEHLVKDIEILLTCDAIYLINGWTDSDGAQIECFVADNRGLRVFSYHTPVEMLHEYVTDFAHKQADNNN
ncbi:MAG: DUF4406 domain-containing protein [Paludibacteraceae bacterium]|nr:DUF4406 domain-containing protein [Paludibacteraceae bacterium]